MLTENGWVITNSTPHINIPNYPEIEEIISESRNPNHIIIDADTIAKEIESPKSVNMVVMGASLQHLGIDTKYFEKAIKNSF